MKITKSQTKLTAIRSDRSNLHRHPIQSSFTHVSSLIHSRDGARRGGDRWSLLCSSRFFVPARCLQARRNRNTVHGILLAADLPITKKIGQTQIQRRCEMRCVCIMSTILLIILILLLIGALPTWPYSTGWGYYPSGGLGLILLIVLLVVLLR